jgi:N-acetylmuramoyl-L-alanine amidase
MKLLGRAVAFAAVSFAGAAGVAFTAPSQAEESEAGPAEVHYTDHIAAQAPLADDIAINGIEDLAPAAADAAPVIEHAVATVEPAPLGPLEDMKPIISELEEQEKARPKSLAQLVAEHAGSSVPDAQFECLAGAVYFEAKSEPLIGQLAVAEVIINRSKSGRFPASLCGVVKQRGQFSFVRGGQLPPIPRGSRQWHQAVAISHIALKELSRGNAPRALFFHAKHVSPRWRLTRVASVGNHIFYR